MKLPLVTLPARVRDDLASHPVVANGLVIFAVRAGAIVAIDPESGAVRWERAVRIPRGATVTLVQRGACVLACIAAAKQMGALVQLAVETGDELWRLPAPRPYFAQVAAVAGDLLVDAGDGAITACTIDGRTLWTYESETPQLDPPLMCADVVLAPDADGLVALDLGTGGVRWRIAGDPAVAIAHVGELAIVRVGGQLFGLDTASGQPRWQQAIVGVPHARHHVVAGAELVALDRLRIERRALATGELIAARELTRADVPMRAFAAIYCMPAITDAHIVATCPTGPVIVFDRETLAVDWYTDISARREAMRAPLVAAGRVFVTDLEGRLDLLAPTV